MNRPIRIEGNNICEKCLHKNICQKMIKWTINSDNCTNYLPERPHGDWRDFSDEGYVECPFCEHATTCDDNIDELHYCFFCGAELKKSGAAK